MNPFATLRLVGVMLAGLVAFPVCASAYIQSFYVTPANQKTLELDFELVVRKHERAFIVELVIPERSALEAVSRLGFYASSSDHFWDRSGVSLPDMGLTRFARSKRTAPEEVEWVRGIRLWLGEDVFPRTRINFEFRNKLYIVDLPTYAPSP